MSDDRRNSTEGDAILDGLKGARGEGGSMRPLYPHGTLFLVRPVGPVELKPGDLVKIQNDNRIIVHRFIRWTGGPARRLITKGDGTTDPDPPWPEEALAGRVAAYVHKGEIRPLDTPMRRLGGRLIAKISIPSGKVLRLLLKLKHSIEAIRR